MNTLFGLAFAILVLAWVFLVPNELKQMMYTGTCWLTAVIILGIAVAVRLAGRE